MPSKLIKHSKRGSNKLTDKQRVFVDEYLADNEMNAAEAARKAGYAGKTAAPKLLANKEVQKEIGKRMRQRSERTEITADRVLQELASMAFVNLRTYVKEDGSFKDLHEMTEEEAAPIESVNRAWDGIKEEYIVLGYSFWDKQWALEKLVQHLGMIDPRFKQEDSGQSIQNFLSIIVNNAEKNNVIDGDFISQLAQE